MPLAPQLTRLFMIASALVLALLALIGTFAPDVVLTRLNAPLTTPLLLVVQVVGALYAGFAALNWMSRDCWIGGIYSRPLVIANLLHFLVAGLAMIRALVDAPSLVALWVFAAIYAMFAVGFGVVMMRHPGGSQG